MIDDYLGGHGQSPGALLALGLAGAGVQAAMATVAIDIEGRGAAAIRVGGPVFDCRAAPLHFESASFVEAGPSYMGEGHFMSLARHNVADTKLMRGVGHWADGNAEGVAFHAGRGDDEGIAQVLMTDLIEGAEQPDARLDGDHLAMEGDGAAGRENRRL